MCCRARCIDKEKEVRRKERMLKDAEQLATRLLESADLVVADEAHQIKNPASDSARALMRIKTKKRIALTGYPLQNRLPEYITTPSIPTHP